MVVVYKTFNPMQHGFFPKCPFLMATGLECPGCGSQRALHHLLNLNIGAAFLQNPLMVTAIPYIILGFIFNLKQNPSEKWLKWRSRLFGRTAIYIVFVIVVGFWIVRNLVCFHC